MCSAYRAFCIVPVTLPTTDKHSPFGTRSREGAVWLCAAAVAVYRRLLRERESINLAAIYPALDVNLVISIRAQQVDHMHYLATPGNIRHMRLRRLDGTVLK